MLGLYSLETISKSVCTFSLEEMLERLVKTRKNHRYLIYYASVGIVAVSPKRLLHIDTFWLILLKDHMRNVHNRRGTCADC